MWRFFLCRHLTNEGRWCPLRANIHIRMYVSAYMCVCMYVSARVKIFNVRNFDDFCHSIFDFCFCNFSSVFDFPFRCLVQKHGYVCTYNRKRFQCADKRTARVNGVHTIRQPKFIKCLLCVLQQQRLRRTGKAKEKNRRRDANRQLRRKDDLP